MKAALLLGILVYSAGCVAASPKRMLLSFDDNLIPTGWSLYVPSPGSATNYGIANGRFFAGSTDNRAILENLYDALPTTKNVTFDWFGSVVESQFGASQAVQFLGPDGFYAMARITADTDLHGPGVRIEIEAPGASLSPTQLLLPVGTYHFKAEFTTSGIRFSGALNGAKMFSESLVTRSVDPQRFAAAQLFVQQTVGPDMWMDNVKIIQFPCTKPVRGVCLSD